MGVVQFHVSVRVGMEEFEAWKPEQIAAFLAGVAQVLTAARVLTAAGEEVRRAE
jgi:hypothetical protein